MGAIHCAHTGLTYNDTALAVFRKLEILRA